MPTTTTKEAPLSGVVAGRKSTEDFHGLIGLRSVCVLNALAGRRSATARQVHQEISGLRHSRLAIRELTVASTLESLAMAGLVERIATPGRPRFQLSELGREVVCLAIGRPCRRTVQ